MKQQQQKTLKSNQYLEHITHIQRLLWFIFLQLVVCLLEKQNLKKSTPYLSLIRTFSICLLQNLVLKWHNYTITINLRYTGAELRWQLKSAARHSTVKELIKTFVALTLYDLVWSVSPVTDRDGTEGNNLIIPQNKNKYTYAQEIISGAFNFHFVFSSFLRTLGMSKEWLHLCICIEFVKENAKYIQ